MARVAPEGVDKKFDSTRPKTPKTKEKSMLIINVFGILDLKESAKNPGTKSRVSIRIVPATLILVTIKKAKTIKNK